MKVILLKKRVRKVQNRLVKSGHFVEKKDKKRPNHMKIHLPLKSGGLSGRLYFPRELDQYY
jgi:hypothetical protein